MLDIEMFRKDADAIRESEKKRFKDPKRVDEVIRLDGEWREALKGLELLRNKRNIVSEEINKMKKEGKDTKGKIEEMRLVNAQIAELEKKCGLLLAERDAIRYSIGNVLHKDVPVAKDESGARVVREWGEIRKKAFAPKSHVDLLVQRGLADIDTAGEISGARFYFLKGELVRLNFALINYAIDFLVNEGYTPMHTPFIMRKEYMKRAAELSDFEHTLYKIDGEDAFLIATAEQPLASYYADKILNEDELPIKLAGFSTNFRKEAGAHGKDTKGIFRVHQFEKVEQYIYCLPEESWMWHERLIETSERIIQGLGLPYRVVDIASGDMNDNAARKYDIEVWMPVQNTYRELVSCSNTTDYQARKMNVRVLRKGGEKQVVHTLNSTALATERAIVAIVENFQEEDGTITVPHALRKYMSGKDKI
ncbi:MAG: serine--tRNA ligase [Candidatus Micrarchaeota archaeon]|nr:serine--tRNA ligase [Candidatus Micrarchaeota archaeon]